MLVLSLLAGAFYVAYVALFVGIPSQLGGVMTTFLAIFGTFWTGATMTYGLFISITITGEMTERNHHSDAQEGFFDVIEILIRKYWHIITTLVAIIWMMVSLMIDVSTIRETVRQHENEISVTKTNMLVLREDILLLKEQMRYTNTSLQELKGLMERVDQKLR